MRLSASLKTPTMLAVRFVGDCRSMDKAAVAEFLGVSERAVERYAQEGKLSVKYVPGKRGKRAEYSEAEVSALKQELQAPVHRSFVAPKADQHLVSSTISDPDVSEIVGLSNSLTSPQALEFLEVVAHSQKIMQLWNRLVWNLEEAAIATGFSRFHLRQAIALGNLRGKKVGRGWKVRPEDLQEYTKLLFTDLLTPTPVQSLHQPKNE